MANQILTQAQLGVTLTIKDLDGNPISLDKKIIDRQLLIQVGTNALIDVFLRGAINGARIDTWQDNRAVLTRQVIKKVNKRSEKLVFEEVKIDFTKPIARKMYQYAYIYSQADLNNVRRMSEDAGNILVYYKDAIINDLMDQLVEDAKGYKTFENADQKTRSDQPTTETTTAKSITAIKNGQRYTGKITDLFDVPTDAKDDYNAFKLTLEAVNYLKRLGTKKAKKDKFYPFAKYGFNHNQIVIFATTDAVNTMRANPSKVTIFTEGSGGTKQMYNTQIGSLNGIPVVQCNELPGDTEILVATNRTLFCLPVEVPGVPILTMERGTGNVVYVGAGQEKLESLHPDQVKVYGSRTYHHGTAFEGEAIFING